MPCYDSDRIRLQDTRVRLDKVTRLLCQHCKAHEPAPCTELAAWWQEHQEKDRARIERAIEAKAGKILKLERQIRRQRERIENARTDERYGHVELLTDTLGQLVRMLEDVEKREAD